MSGMAKDSVDITLDTREFEAALREYMRFTSKTLPEAINRTAVDAAFKANQATRRSKLKKQPWSKLSKRQKNLFHALATGSTRLGKTRFGTATKGQGNDELAQKIYGARTRAVNYSRAIFLKLAKDVGGSVRTKLGRDLPGNATAKKAKESLKPEAVFTIKGVDAKHAREIIQPAMQAGLDRAAQDKRDYIAKKMAAEAKKRSGR